MPVISLPVIWIIIIDIFAWAFFHLFISVLCLRLPLEFFLKDTYWFKIFRWERSGQLWQKWFKVKKWKSSIIDGTIFLKKGYGKKSLHGSKIDDLKIFATETKRAELTHWLSILPAPLFFLWNPLWAGWVMILYALLFNLPIIIVQRYNRGRIQSIIS
ncbi:glycosyl-4,4'-diaponeurosporenoate acyltransferase precursor [Gracilibacillus boraciitolerans JCM 21714]|uniref:Glycosyl-4,4'-diaponeurosporenoate acyltransferase n=1 Tax=Gracilibacillus boraciitolerans JCM 21714 TaxID=1298598 RepID=W4VJJ5_9BACI|nr:glycosyl-4,4'-diaponeurosporenoate acyltransferase [Gracilibacillus boraciitolerans]GAE92919.1 glycosyl-4,4'-diaponeurosporenoate acyltransferase precursor [Gracilibacillus boraciitolerans JCM 21714]